MLGLNLVVSIGAIAGIIVGLVMRNDVEAKVTSICEFCRSAYITYMVLLSVLLLLSLVGFFAICSRNVCLRSLYFIFMFLVFVIGLAICVFYILFTTKIISMERGWDIMVDKRSSELCEKELLLNCSGWLTPCNGNKASDKDNKCPVCTEEQQEKISLFAETCEAVVLRKLKSFAIMVLPVGFGTVLITLLAMIASCVAKPERMF